MKSATCAICEKTAIGRFDAAHLEKSGWRKIGGNWVCGFCNGAGWAGLHFDGPAPTGKASEGDSNG